MMGPISNQLVHLLEILLHKQVLLQISVVFKKLANFEIRIIAVLQIDIVFK
jgi:hypothetical protein